MMPLPHLAPLSGNVYHGKLHQTCWTTKMSCQSVQQEAKAHMVTISHHPNLPITFSCRSPERVEKFKLIQSNKA